MSFSFTAIARADAPATDRDKEIALALEAGPPSVTARAGAFRRAVQAGTLKAPARPGVIYMMSPHNVVTVDEEHGIAAPFPAHLMFYAPNLSSGDLGSDGGT